MAFQAEKTKLPRAFSKDQTAGSSVIRPRRCAAEITGYDLAHATLIARRLDDDQVLEISIDPAKVAKQRQRDAERAANPNKAASAKDAGSWNGSYIDEAMSEKVPVGSLIAVEGAKFQKKFKVGNEERQALQANWIHHVPDNNPDKLLVGVITGSSYQNRMNYAQVWDKALSTVTQAGEDAVTALANEMDQNVANYSKDDYKPRQGVQFRTYVKTGKTKDVWSREEGKKVPKPLVQAIEASFTYDWNFQDAEGDEEAVSVPLSGETMLDRLNAYMDYIDKRYEGQETITEVLPYKSYFVSKTDNSFDANPSGFNYVVKKMVGTPLRLAVGEDEDFYTGRNYAVNGMLMLVKDQIGQDKTTKKPTIKEQFLAARLFTEGFYGPLLSQIPTAEGDLVELHPDLNEQPKLNADNEQKAGQKSAPAEKFESSLAASDEADPFGSAPDPYGQAFDVSGDSSDSAAAEPAAAPAPAPAAEPAAETPPARGGLRNRRIGS